MNALTHILLMLLARWNVPREGIEIIIRFPSNENAYRAISSMRQDLHPSDAVSMTIDGKPVGSGAKMNGVGVWLVGPGL